MSGSVPGRILALAVLLAPSAAPAANVLWVGWDGADHAVVSDMLADGDLPNLAQLVAAGSFGRMEIETATSTRPSWSSQMTGYPDWIMGLEDPHNSYVALPKNSTILELTRLTGRGAIFVANKCKYNEEGVPISGHMCVGSDNLGRPYPFFWFTLLDFVQTNADFTSAQVTDFCFQGATQIGWNGVVFCHYATPDHTGHAYGGDSVEYRNALAEVDVELGVLLAGMPPGTKVLLTSDHGFHCGEPEDATMARVDANCKRHLRAPRAIIAANVPLSTGANQRDVFKTLVSLVGGISYPDHRPEGRDLTLP